jgi:hypothetical protein
MCGASCCRAAPAQSLSRSSRDRASLSTSGGTTTVKARLSGSQPSTEFRIELYSNPVCDPSGNGEGKDFLGAKTITTDSSGAKTFTMAVAAVAPGLQLTETDLITGAGWRWLPPAARLIPSPALSRIELPRIESPKVVKLLSGDWTRTPSPLLKAIVLRASASVPPSVLFFGPSVKRTPNWPFGIAAVALASVPTCLRCAR